MERDTLRELHTTLAFHRADNELQQLWFAEKETLWALGRAAPCGNCGYASPFELGGNIRWQCTADTHRDCPIVREAAADLALRLEHSYAIPALEGGE